MTALTEVFVSVKPDMNKFGPEVKKKLSAIDTKAEGSKVAGRFGVGFNGAFGGIVKHSAGLFVGAFAAIKGAQFLGGFINDARESAKVARVSAQVIKSTGGVAGITAAQIGDLATAISNKTGADDEAIQSGENLLATFTNVRNETGKGNDIFNRASQAAVDMASAMNNGVVDANGLKSANIQLGKALNDPVKGVTALSKVGVSFTAKQKEQIKTLVDSGKTLEAQKIILGEVGKEFGGAAAAAADPLTRLQTIAGNLAEKVGGFLLPTVDKFASFIGETAIPKIGAFSDVFAAKVTPKLQEFGGFLNAEVVPRLKDFAGFFKGEIIPRLKDFGGFITGTVVPAVGNLVASFTPLAKDIGSAVVAAFEKLGPILKSIGEFIAGTIVPAVVDFTKWLKDNSTVVGAVAVGVGAMVAAFGAYKLALAVGAAATKAYAVVQGVLNAVMSANPIGIVVLALVGLAAGLAYAWAKSERFREVVTGVWNAIKGTTSTVFGAVIGFVKGAIDWIKDNWPLLLAILTGPIGIAVYEIAKHWGTIKAGFSSAVGWVKGAFSSAWSVVKTIVTAPVILAKDAVGVAWGKVKGAFTSAKDWATGTFSRGWSALKTIVTKPITDAKAALGTILGAGKSGIRKIFTDAVAGISTIWNGLQELAKKPIRFIVNTVLNSGLIDAFNWIAGKFDDKLKIGHITLPKGFAHGGRIAGDPSDTDNTWGSHLGKAIPLATGEFIVNARQTSKNLPLLKAINAGDGFANGGLLGSLKNAVTKAYGTGKGFVGDVADFTKDAAGWLKKKFTGPLDKLNSLGDSAFAKIVSAAPRKLGDTIVGKAKDLFKDFFGGGVSVGGPNSPPGNVVNFRGVRLNERTISMLMSAERILGKAFHITQGSYSTRVAASGSTHAGGGAMDTNDAGAGWPQAQSVLRSVGFAAWWRRPWQGPWNDHIHSIARGDPTASQAAKNQVADFLRGGDGLGGRASGGPVGVYDRGGKWPSGTFGYNGSGKTETVVPGDGKLELGEKSLRRLAELLSGVALVVDVDRLDRSMTRRALSGGF